MTPESGRARPSNDLKNQVQGQSRWYHWVAPSVPLIFVEVFFLFFINRGYPRGRIKMEYPVHINSVFSCKNDPTHIWGWLEIIFGGNKLQ